jgi:hypothetical protein
MKGEEGWKEGRKEQGGVAYLPHPWEEKATIAKSICIETNLNTMKYYSGEQGVDGGTFIALLFLFRCLANETKYTSLQLLGDRHENGLLSSPPSCFQG